jgi:hypothetical protein
MAEHQKKKKKKDTDKHSTHGSVHGSVGGSVKMETAEEAELGLVQIEDVIGSIAVLLRVLQLFCEGHNMKMKSYMRHQRGNLKSYDLVRSTSSYFLFIYLPIYFCCLFYFF